MPKCFFLRIVVLVNAKLLTKQRIKRSPFKNYWRSRVKRKLWDLFAPILIDKPSWGFNRVFWISTTFNRCRSHQYVHTSLNKVSAGAWYEENLHYVGEISYKHYFAFEITRIGHSNILRLAHQSKFHQSNFTQITCKEEKFTKLIIQVPCEPLWSMALNISSYHTV